MRPPLNLARRPFRNERLPTLLLAVGGVLLVLLTVRHGFAVRDLLPGGRGDAQAKVARLEKTLAALRKDSDELSRVTAPPDRLKEWEAVKQVVDRRLFSWTALLAALGRSLPPGVRLRSVAPSIRNDRVELQLVASGRTVQDALALPKALQAEGEFEGAFLDSYGETSGDVDISCRVRYVGGAPAAGSAAP